MTTYQIAAKYNIGKSTVSDIKRGASKIKSYIENDISVLETNRKRIGNASNEYGLSKTEINKKMKRENTTESNKQNDLKMRTKTLSFKEKLVCIKEIESGMSVAAICKKYGVGRTTVYDFLRRKDEIREVCKDKKFAQRRTVKQGKYPELERRLVEFCLSCDAFLSKAAMCEQAKCIHEEMGYEGSFNANSSWVKKFIERNPNVKSKIANMKEEAPQEGDESEYSPDEIAINVHGASGSKYAIKSETSPVKSKPESGTSSKNLLSISNKLRVLEDIENGGIISEIANKYAISKTTVYEIFRRKDEYRACIKSGKSLSKKIIVSRLSELEKELFEWCMKQKRFPISVTSISDQAKNIFEQLEMNGTFAAGSGWVRKFVKRHPELSKRQGLEESDSDYDETNCDPLMTPESLFLEEQAMDLDESSETINNKSPMQDSSVMPIPDFNLFDYVNENNTVDDNSTHTVTDQMAMKSIRTLIRYSNERGHLKFLPNLLAFQEVLDDDQSNL